MNIINVQHVVLHQEAVCALNRASQIGWEEAFILMDRSDMCYPTIHIRTDDETLTLYTNADGIYTVQVLPGIGTIKYRHPILSPGQIVAIRGIVRLGEK
jgi:hypothetical protein